MHREFRSYFEGQRAWLEQFLTGLLAIPSESGREQPAGDYLYEALAGLGAVCERLPIPNTIRNHPDYAYPVCDLDYTGRFNLRLEKAGRGGKILALNSHYDVVPPSPGQADAYLPRLEDGVVYARGACDAKGQIAAMALLAKAACELPPLGSTVLCHMVVEEEFGGNGTLAMVEQGVEADALVNLEPTELRMMAAIRGAVWFDMCFAGTAGHAGSAGNTQSALYKAMAAVELLRAYHRRLSDTSKDYGLFSGMPNPMPLTVGQMQAGVWPSMVPGEARVRGVMGFLPNTNKETVMGDIRALLGRDENRWISDGMTLDFDYRHNAVELPAGHWLQRNMGEAMARCGLDPEPTAMTASTDAVFYHERGIPCIAFGPGSITDAHSSHEKVRIDDIITAAETLYTLAAML